MIAHVSGSVKPTGSSLPLRWAGGKRLIVPRLLEFLPGSFRTYYEPMLGSGALFFHLQASQAVLGDINAELIDFFRVLKRCPYKLLGAIDELRPSKASYYEVRAAIPSSAMSRAARFYFLVRLSWNGLYRVNKRGLFNVPFGGRTPSILLPRETALAASRSLRTATLLYGDFEQTTASAKEGDLVYFDPPYPKGASWSNGFNRYHETRFTLEDHKRLARHACVLADRGVYVLITEAARRELIRLYPNSFDITYLRTRSLIAAESARRGTVYECVLTSYRM